MSFLRATFFLAIIISTLGESSVSANIDAVAEVSEGNATLNSSSPSRYLEEAATDYHTALLDAVNKERVAHGISKLCKNGKLQSAAEIHSNDMAKRNFLSHSGSDGSTITSRIGVAGFHWTAAAENIAAGQSTVSSVMSSWMGSSPHRANLLSKQYKYFGCGYAYSSSSKFKHYWTQDFTSGTGEVCG